MVYGACADMLAGGIFQKRAKGELVVIGTEVWGYILACCWMLFPAVVEVCVYVYK
jgi:hypothetical protein